jgi:DNA repair ATPase RecN
MIEKDKSDELLQNQVNDLHQKLTKTMVKVTQKRKETPLKINKLVGKYLNLLTDLTQNAIVEGN